MMGFVRLDGVLSRLDLFPKLDNSYRLRSAVGGVLSLISLALGIVFAGIELHAWCHPPVRQRYGIIAVRPTESDGRTLSGRSEQRLNVRLLLTVDEVPCYLLHVDPLDPITSHPIPAEDVSVDWIRVARDGRVLGSLPDDLYVRGAVQDGDCSLGPRFPDHCDTCEEVIRVHRVNELDLAWLGRYAQCAEAVTRMREMDEESCTINASMNMVRIAASFHVAPGIPYERRGWHMHSAVPFGRTADSFNLTHRGAVAYGQAGFKRFEYVQTGKGVANIQYWSDVMESDFSIASHSITNASVPQLEWRFDLSPIRADPYLDREPVMRLLTRLCCVVGGTIGIARFLDYLVTKARRRAQARRIEQH